MVGNGTNGNGKGAPNLSQEEYDDLIQALEDGVPMPAAFGGVGISRSSFYRLKEKAEAASKGQLKVWWDCITRARDRGEWALWRRVSKGGKGTGGAQWVLERSYHYYKVERQEIDAKTETKGEVEYVLKRIPPREAKPKTEAKADEGK